MPAVRDHDATVAALEHAAAWSAIAAALDELRRAGLDYWLTVDMPGGLAFQSWKPGGRHEWGNRRGTE